MVWRRRAAWVGSAVVVVTALTFAPARAASESLPARVGEAIVGDVPARTKSPPPQDVSSGPTVAPPTEMPVSRGASRANPRALCGCPSARLLGRGPIDLDAGGVAAAWLHDGAVLDTFTLEPGERRRVVRADVPLAIGAFALGDATTPYPSTSRLVRAYATAPLPQGTLLGVMRKVDQAPRDVAAVRGMGTAEPPLHGPPPQLQALWLSPLEERERPGCGRWLTHRLAVEPLAESPAIDAFLVSDREAQLTALVDARAVGAFGIGHVAVCDQGLPLRGGGAVELEIRPVSAAFGIGEAWQFASDGLGATDPTRLHVPSTANHARLEEPFPVPGQAMGHGPSAKEIAAAVMGAIVVGAIIVAFVVWVVIPARRRRLKDIACPACGAGIPVDTLDPQTDGFFCPRCGASGFWKGDARVLPKTP